MTWARDINSALRFTREVQSANVITDWTPLWRADLMCYGSFKKSEAVEAGPRHALGETIETKKLCVALLSTRTEEYHSRRPKGMEIRSYVYIVCLR